MKMNRKKTLLRTARIAGVTVKDMFKYPIQNTFASIIAMGGKKEKIRAAFTQLGTICDEHTKLLEMMAQAQSERDALKLSLSDLQDSNKTLHDLSNEFRQRYDALRAFLEEFHPESLKNFDWCWWETQKAIRMNAAQDEIENVNIRQFKEVTIDSNGKIDELASTEITG